MRGQGTSPWQSPITVEAPGLNGGDVWAGARGSDEEFEFTLNDAMSTTIRAPIIPQFYPQRKWLWARWNGTILKRVLPREVLFNSIFAIVCVLVVSAVPQQIARPSARRFLGGAATAAPVVAASWLPVLDNIVTRTVVSTLASVDKVWLLASGLVSFTLSFFLTQSYAFWRSVYAYTRKVQGRLNDIGMLCAAAAEREGRTGEYTEDAKVLLALIGRYVRLFSMLFYASCTSRFAALRTPRGLGAMVTRGALSNSERNALLQSSMGHYAVLEWLSTLLNSGLSDGRLCGGATGGNPLGLQIQLQAKLVELRMATASIEDELTGRMPLAYTQLVQIMADLLISFAPFALIHSVGGVGAVMGTALVTLFYSSILNLAKSFLDPLNNDLYSGNMGINVATLIQETNVGSERWCKSATWVPDVALPRTAATARPRAREAEAADGTPLPDEAAVVAAAAVTALYDGGAGGLSSTASFPSDGAVPLSLLAQSEHVPAAVEGGDAAAASDSSGGSSADGIAEGVTDGAPAVEGSGRRDLHPVDI